jgi:hypothetical protein
MVEENAATTSEVGSKVLVKPLPHILNELDKNIKAAEEAATRAGASARLAEQAAANAVAAAEEARATGEKIAQEAIQEALVKAVIKRLSRWDWIATIVVINLALIFCAVLIAFALAKAL